jgi:hypothetical protein
MQLDLEANLARAGLSAIEARYVYSDELDLVAKRNEWPPEVERFGSGAADVQNTYTSGPRRKRRKIECQTKLRRVAGKRFGRKSTPSKLLQR